MPSILTDGNYQRIFATGMDSMCSDFVLIKHTNDGYDPVLGVETIPEDDEFTCRAIITDYRLHDIGGSGGLIQLGDRNLIVMCGSFADTTTIVEPNDQIKTADGNSTFTVVTARQDPVQATWSLQIRKI